MKFMYKNKYRKKFFNKLFTYFEKYNQRKNNVSIIIVTREYLRGKLRKHIETPSESLVSYQIEQLIISIIEAREEIDFQISELEYAKDGKYLIIKYFLKSNILWTDKGIIIAIHKAM
jgi:hypothetical protein